MLRNIFDTHAHYNDDRFEEDRYLVLSSLPESGVCGVINCGTDVSSSAASKKLAETYDYIRFAAGVHPEDCAKPQTETDLGVIESMLSHPKCVAVGEIGLDYYWQEVPRELQLCFFEKQLRLANEHNLPVIIHDREAHGDTMELVKKYRPRGVLHCYSGSVEFMRDYVKLGMYLGFGGSVTFKNAKKTVEVAAEIPLDRLLLETDCPYLAPVPFRGKRNTSALIPYTAERIAQIRGMEPQKLVDLATENAKRLFSL